MRSHNLVSALALSGLAASSPLFKRAGTDSAASIILKIMPHSASCDPSNTECRTADQAAPYLINAFSNYKVYTYGEMAAMLALIALESVEMQYKHNLAGNPGQGTSNMQMATFNAAYAISIPALAPCVAKAGGDPNQILACVTPDEYNFGSAPWYYTTKCSQDVRSKLQDNTQLEAGWAAYLQCVGTADTSQRDAYWKAAKAAFGLPGGA